jgi:hypothetical protein
MNSDSAAHRLLRQAQTALIRKNIQKAKELLDHLLIDFPASAAASSIRRLSAYLTPPPDFASNATLSIDQVEAIQKMLSAATRIQEGYSSADPDKQKALRAILGDDFFRTLSATPPSA